MSYYPVLLDLTGKKVVVLGGGVVAQRKVESLIGCGADVHIISRELTSLLKGYVEEGKARHTGEEFTGEELNGAILVIAATDDASLNREVSRMAQRRGIFVNAVDQPSDCTFIVPSVVRRGDLIIAISTSGKSPALAKRIRERLSRQFGREYESFLLMMGRIREEIRSRGLPQKENSRIFHELIDSPILEAIRNRAYNEIAALLTGILGRRVSPEDVRDYMGAA
jgi:precorrin-2 dehydrogenase/sirohydrochlorin ferrochelatase